MFICEFCGDDHEREEINSISVNYNNTLICDTCLETLKKCEWCEQHYRIEDIDLNGHCEECNEEYLEYQQKEKKYNRMACEDTPYRY